jgi:hypothetical protein
MTRPLLNFTTNNGSRHFGALPQAADWNRLREHIRILEGATVTNFITDGIVEAWIDFDYHGHRFSVNNQFGDYWFFVEDQLCPDSILEEVPSHCALLLGDA